MKNEQDSAGVSPVTRGQSESAERVRRHRERERERQLMYRRGDWHLFLDLATLTQKAGCHANDLPKIILKEVADNALDCGAEVTLAHNDGTWIIDDDGPGMSLDQIQTLYAVNRPLISSKLKRLPLRGMLGNGLRVVMGGVTAYEGSIVVESREHRLTLAVDKATGQTIVEDDSPSDKVDGLRVCLNLGAAPMENAGFLAEESIAFASHGEPYSGPSNPWWYGPKDLEDLFKFAPEKATVREVCRDLGLWYQRDHYNRQARTLTRDEVEVVLNNLRENTKQIKPEDLGPSGPGLREQAFYAMKAGITTTQSGAQVPYVVEAWATCKRADTKGQGSATIALFMNRSRTLARLTGWSLPKVMEIEGCGIERGIYGLGTADYRIIVSVISPYIQLATDGKEPELKPYGEAIGEVLKKACGQAFRAMEVPLKGMAITTAGYLVMREAYLLASGNGKYPANFRQIYYAARPKVLEMTKRNVLKSSYFIQTVIRGYLEDKPHETADWDVVADARGNLTEPHTDRTVPLGTVAVREYLAKKPDMSNVSDLAGNEMYPTVGPENRYGAVLFIEKEGFDAIWHAAKFSERYDIALMSTKGLSVEAARKLVDETCARGVSKVLVLRDFDLTGFKIFGTLGTDSKVYRFRHDIEGRIIDIGLRLKDAQALGLEPEQVEIKGDWEAHSWTLTRHGATQEEIDYLGTVQEIDGKKFCRRIELNAMTAPVFVQFLEAKFAEHGIKKVVPTPEILEAQARRIIERDLAQNLIDESLEWIQQEAAAATVPKNLEKRVRTLLTKHPELSWDAAVTEIVRA